MDPSLPKKDQGINLSKLSKKTVVFILLGIAASLGASVYILFFTGPAAPKLTNIFKAKAPTVAPKTIVANPFKKETQFVNPFNPVKSPFYALDQLVDAELAKDNK